jgi:hypothetical protein
LPGATRRRLYGFYALTVVLPALAAVAGLIFAWEMIAEGYLHRDFTPWERLLTQSRVLFFYLGLLVFPHIRAFGLYHDDLALSTGLLEPWTTLAGVVVWVVLAGLALWGVRRRAIWSFGLLWYLVGHSLESSLLGLELVFEHRNYVPSFGVLFAGAYYLIWALDRVAGTRRLAYPVVGLLVVVLAFTTFTRASIWGDKVTLNLFTAKNHPESYRSLTGAGILNIIGRSDVREIFAVFGRAAMAREANIIPLVEMSKIAAGLRVLIGGQANAETQGRGRSSDSELIEQPLILSVPYLMAVESAVDREIRHRLQAYPVKAESAYALERLYECIRKRVDVCVPLLDNLQKWYDDALGNPKMTTNVRGILQLNRGLLHEDLGELDLAANRLREAVASDPHNLSYPLTLAKFYIRNEQWDEADGILDMLEANRPWSGFGSRHVNWLRQQYEARRKPDDVNVQ